MMTDKVKDSLRKALELAMENSENITITQSNKVIAQVKDKEEPKPPAPCEIPKDILNGWTSIMTVMIQDMAYNAAYNRISYNLMAKYTKAIDRLRQSIWLELHPEYDDSRYGRGDFELITEIEENFLWEPGNDGSLPRYNYFKI